MPRKLSETRIRILRRLAERDIERDGAETAAEIAEGCCPDFRQWVERAKAGEPTVEERHKAKLRKDLPFIGLPLGNGKWV